MSKPTFKVLTKDGVEFAIEADEMDGGYGEMLVFKDIVGKDGVTVAVFAKDAWAFVIKVPEG